MIKQVIVIRKDLGMRKGKMIAQGAHASISVLFHDNDFVKIDKTLKEWLTNGMTKIVLGIESESDLLTLWSHACNNRLRCELIKDAGKTEFNGVPTYTALAIGPDKSELIDRLTGDLKLL